MSEKNYEVATVNEKQSFVSKAYEKVLVASIVAMPAFAFAVEGETGGALDMSAAVTQLGYGIAAIGALGAAKLAPSALMWVWRKVNNSATS